MSTNNTVLVFCGKEENSTALLEAAHKHFIQHGYTKIKLMDKTLTNFLHTEWLLGTNYTILTDLFSLDHLPQWGVNSLKLTRLFVYEQSCLMKVNSMDGDRGIFTRR